MMDGATAEHAIQAALSQNWKEAIRINSELIKIDKNNIDALNRLGFAYLRSGNQSLAKKCFTKVLTLDSYNLIAEKNLKKLPVLKKRGMEEEYGNKKSHLSPLMFLEEPGKTKIVPCLNVAPARILSTVTSGQEVYLKAKKHCVEIRDHANTYLGVLPDDISFKLIKYITGGNTYNAYIRSVGKNALTVFIREGIRGKKFTKQPSFSSFSSFIPRSVQEASHQEKPDMSATGEEDDNETTDESAQER